MSEHGSVPLILTSTGRAQLADGPDAPRADFDLLATRLRGGILYPDERPSSPPVSALESRLRLGLSQAVRARRANAVAYISFSERVGLPLSLLRPTAPHVLIAHLLTSRQKRRTAAATGYLARTDVTLVFARPQEQYLRDELGLGPDRAQFIWDKVDARFFAPAETPAAEGFVLSVGREQRDYRTLVEALRRVALPGVIVAGSTWSHRAVTPLSLPDHVELRSGLSYAELRDLYRRARVVVVPVVAGTDYAAGVNTVLEAMSCGRPLIVSQTPGLNGYVRDRVDGRTVAPDDPDALAELIGELWDDTGQAERLGAAARATVEGERTVEHFVERVARLIETLV